VSKISGPEGQQAMSLIIAILVLVVFTSFVSADGPRKRGW
jgi:hypothetical protein